MHKNQKQLFRILKVTFISAIIAVFGLLVKGYVNQLGLFHDIHIEIKGNQFVAQNIILEKVTPFLDQSLLSLDLADIQNGVSSLDFVESVQVSRILPETLLLQILERKPILLFTLDKQNLFMDKNGLLIPAEGHSISFFPVPIITISEEVEYLDMLPSQAFELFRYIIDDYPVFYDNLSEVIIEDDKWTFFSDSKTRIFTKSDQPAAQLNILKYFEKTVFPNRVLKDYSYIDLRVTEQIVVKEKYRKG